jgi:sarcosine oxidase
MGCAAARSLAQRGISATVVEQFHIGHTRGSSHGASRIFRFSYPDARYVAMAMQALPLWRALERDSDESLLTTTGGLDRGADLNSHVSALGACGASYEVVPTGQVRARWPHLSLPEDEPVLYQPDAGVVFADRAVSALARDFVATGGSINEGVRVGAIHAKSTEVEIETTDGPYAAACVIVTAGAWARPLLATAGIELATRPTRETVAYFDYEGPSPPTLVEWGEPTVYALPSLGHRIKAGEHIAGPTTDPDEEGRVNEESIKRVTEWVGSRFPSATKNPSHSETCIYTNTADESFVLKRYGRIIVGSPCSGHGFKFAPLIGQQLADLAQHALSD